MSASLFEQEARIPDKASRDQAVGTRTERRPSWPFLQVNLASVTFRVGKGVLRSGSDLHLHPY